MYRIKKILSINTLILLGAFAFLTFGIRQIFEIFYDFNDLILHKGQIAATYIFTEKPGEKDSLRVIKLRFTGGEEFIVSRYIKRLNNLVQTGDSVELYTKEVTSKFGNLITNGEGQTWNTRDEKEVFHLVSNRYEAPLIDFQENRKHLLRTSWGFPFFSLCFLGWFFYRRSRRKSPLVKE